MRDSLGFLATPLFFKWLMAGIVFEAILLVIIHRRTNRGPRPAEVLTFLGAGLAFVVALFAIRAHNDVSATFIIALTLALVFHVWHLALLAKR